MSRIHRTLIVATGVFLLAAAPALALIHPKTIAPKSGHKIRAGSRPTFSVRDTAKKDQFNNLYFSLTGKKKVDKCGKLANPLDGKGEYKRMYRKKGTTHTYVAKASAFSFAGFWREKPGTYYWQASRNQFHGTCSAVYSKVYRIIVR